MNVQWTKTAEGHLEVAEVKPYKKGRLKVLARERRDLREKLDQTGLIMAYHC